MIKFDIFNEKNEYNGIKNCVGTDDLFLINDFLSVFGGHMFLCKKYLIYNFQATTYYLL